MPETGGVARSRLKGTRTAPAVATIQSATVVELLTHLL
jgi:hypothetical protein